ncbi:MAG TPA: twin-arginine translocase subunit TatC [Fimbriiglobus sp.]|jgi:sec-independent protein translocase protein TatC
MFFSADKYNYPDDIFAQSRMSFADHIGELQVRLKRAVYVLLVFLIGGFLLDSIGQEMGWDHVGLGRPMLRFIKEPFEEQVRDFYRKRNLRVEKKVATLQRTDPAEAARILDKLKQNEGSLLALTADERQALLAIPYEMQAFIPVEALKAQFGEPKNPDAKEIETTILVYPSQITYLNTLGETALGNKQYITTLSVQEGFVVYFKVTLISSIILASPWIFYQFWAFVAAGLYPHERRYVHVYLPFSVGLFLLGVLICQFLVLPGAIKALLGFNNWGDFDPDLRLNESLSFAIMLPLVFGISFQTPLVMLFLNRIGLFDATSYWKKWRHAVMFLAAFSAIITPTPDAVTMMYLFVPLFGLYVFGVLLVYFFPAKRSTEEEDDVSNVAV